MYRVQYIGASWCAPCRTVKPLVTILVHKFGCTLEEYDFDSMEEDDKSSVSKLPTVRIWDPIQKKQCIEITRNHAEELETWLKTNVRVKNDADF